MATTTPPISAPFPSLEPILPKGYTLHPGYPPIPDYLHLRAASGLTPKTPAQAAPVAKGSWHGCYIRFTPPESTSDSDAESTIVGMGRIIGDGGWYFHIADMAVLPDHQRKGLGEAVLKHLLGYIKENAPKEGKGAYVTLFADGPGRKLYAKNGFVEAAPKQMGMAMPMGGQTSATVIGNYVYIDGGELSQLTDGKIAKRQTNQVNSTLSIDISKSWSTSDVEFQIIERPWASKANQAIWTNHEEGVFYVWGGKWLFGYNMTKNALWKFTPDGKGAGTWKSVPPSNVAGFDDLQQAEYIAFANTNTTGFAIGGVSTGWTKFRRSRNQVIPGMVAFDMKTRVWSNGTTNFSPFDTLAGASAHYVPSFGPNGIVMVLGGSALSVVGDPDWGGALPYDFRNLSFFDPETKQKYWQIATGDIPPSPRVHICLTGFRSSDGGYEIFMSGGSNQRDQYVYEDAYVLSLPGFVWTKAPDSPAGKRRYASCVAVGNRQMLSIGGTDGTWTKRDPAPQGLLLFDMTEMKWKDSFDANAAAYERPAKLKSFYSDGSFDAVQWSSDEVQQLFKSANPAPSPDPTAAPEPSTPVGAIAGGVVGGVAGLALIATAAWFFMRRRKRQQDVGSTPNSDHGGGYYAAVPSSKPGERGTTELPESNKLPPAELYPERQHAELGGSPVQYGQPAQQPTMVPIEMDATPARQ
ncbi:hypothetical protein N0V88_003431 [Collariella sp. IMI 366227]|nr:hypothetical protein N0V88_003431 [Collariella sp. IMI 366227]